MGEIVARGSAVRELTKRFPDGAPGGYVGSDGCCADTLSAQEGMGDFRLYIKKLKSYPEEAMCILFRATVGMVSSTDRKKLRFCENGGFFAHAPYS